MRNVGMDTPTEWPWNERAIACLYGLWTHLLAKEARAKARGSK